MRICRCRVIWSKGMRLGTCDEVALEVNSRTTCDAGTDESSSRLKMPTGKKGTSARPASGRRSNCCFSYQRASGAVLRVVP